MLLSFIPIGLSVNPVVKPNLLQFWMASIPFLLSHWGCLVTIRYPKKHDDTTIPMRISHKHHFWWPKSHCFMVICPCFPVKSPVKSPRFFGQKMGPRDPDQAPPLSKEMTVRTWKSVYLFSSWLVKSSWKDPGWLVNEHFFHSSFFWIYDIGYRWL